jgi:hypothetical protein
MTAAAVHAFPVRRPGFFQSAEWLGDDAHLTLKCTYFDETGVLRQIQFATRNLSDGERGSICLPASSDLNDLHPTRAADVLAAHTRMSCLIGEAIPGSDEFTTALLQGLSANLNTALGVVKVTAVAAVSDNSVQISYRQGTGPVFNATYDYFDLRTYVFVPDTQAMVVAGSVRKQFNYVHEWPNTIMTQAKKDDIVAYVTQTDTPPVKMPSIWI